MPKPTTYAKSKTTIANILEAAQTLFLSQNYADVSMATIAGEADVTKGALYHHFASKDELYLTMMHSYLEGLQQLSQSVAEGSGSCRERLHRLVKQFLEQPLEKQKLIKLVRRDINIFKDPLRDQLVRAYQAALPDQVEQIIRDGIQTGELADEDPRLLAWEQVAMVEVVLGAYAHQVFSDTDQVVDFVVNLFFEGAAA